MNLKKYLCAISLVAVLASCDDDEPAAANEQALFQKEPFKSISDSIKNHPDEAGLYFRRGLLLTQNNFHEVATADWARAWELSPTESNAWQYVANLLITDQSLKAVEVLRAAIQHFPEHAAIKAKLAEVLGQTNNIEDAIAIYRQLIQQEPDMYEWYYELGRMYAKQRNVAEAIQNMEKAYALLPANYVGLDLAELYAHQLNDKVITLCDEIIANNPPGAIPQASYLKGTYYADKKQFEQAIKCFDESIAADWKFIDAYLDKGYVYYSQEKYNEAEETFATAINVAQTIPDAYYWMGRTLEAKGDREKAIQHYERTLSLDKEFREAAERIKKLKIESGQ